MASSFTPSSCAGSLVLLALSLSLLEGAANVPDVAGNLKVPAVYVLGDSLADVGNNNHLLTIIKTDFPHNGIDFAGGKATGRFSNGKNSADFLAEKLGLPSAPPYLSISSSLHSSQAFSNGVNFASAGAGILDATHSVRALNHIIFVGANPTLYLSFINSRDLEEVPRSPGSISEKSESSEFLAKSFAVEKKIYRREKSLRSEEKNLRREKSLRSTKGILRREKSLREIQSSAGRQFYRRENVYGKLEMGFTVEKYVYGKLLAKAEIRKCFAVEKSLYG